MYKFCKGTIFLLSCLLKVKKKKKQKQKAKLVFVETSSVFLPICFGKKLLTISEI